MDKKSARLKRALRGRSVMRRIEAVRLSVHRTPRHIYAQIISPLDGKTITCASTVEAEIKSAHKIGGNKAVAKEVGKLVAKRALEAGIKKVAFDRSGYQYHGRIAALADGAREAGLDF